MKRINKIGLVIFLVCAILLSFYYTININKERKQEYNEKIDSLNHSIDSLENCINLIKPQIDTIFQTKTITKYIYEKKADSIWNQSANDDWDYYTNFLRTRFPSDGTSVETNQSII